MMSWSSPGSVCIAGQPAAAVPAAPAEPKPAEPTQARVTTSKIEIDGVVQFETGSAILLPQSEGLLSDVAKVMKAHPEIKTVDVEGHTDAEGGTAANLKLSEERAHSVVNFLVKQGVEESRLTHSGKGETEPVADNKTDEGRFKNRRVEFKITKRD